MSTCTNSSQLPANVVNCLLSIMCLRSRQDYPHSSSLSLVLLGVSESASVPEFSRLVRTTLPTRNALQVSTTEEKAQSLRRNHPASAAAAPHEKKGGWRPSHLFTCETQTEKTMKRSDTIEGALGGGINPTA